MNGTELLARLRTLDLDAMADELSVYEVALMERRQWLAASMIGVTRDTLRISPRLNHTA